MKTFRTICIILSLPMVIAGALVPFIGLVLQVAQIID